MRITSAGLVGIGITAPRSILSAASATGSILTLESTDTTLTTNDVVGEIDFYANDGSTGGTGVKASVRAFANDATGNNIALGFATSDGTSLATDRMLITGPGNVGIGTASPAEILHLSKDGALGVRIERTGGSASVGQIYNGGNLLTLSYNLNAITFNTGASPTERMRIDASGNVLVGKTGINLAVVGTEVRQGGVVGVTRDADAPLFLRRNTNIGTIISFSQDANVVGTVSVGTTSTSYNTSSTSGITGVDANTVAIRTNSAERMRIDASGNVGIGATLPGATGISPFLAIGANNAGIGSASTNNIVVVTNNTERMRITAAGDVGIGTSSPDELLHVESSGFATIKIESTGASSDPALSFTNDNGGASEWSLRLDKSASDIFQLRYNNVQRLNVDTSGNLLVGKTASDDTTQGTRIAGGGLISIVRDGNVSLILNRNTSDGATAFFRRSGTTVGSISVTTTATSYNTSSTSGITGVDANTVAFQTNSAERMRITSAGLVGIGTASPGARLDVSGDALVNGLTVGRGAGSDASNTVVGSGALPVNTTGTSNTAVGGESLEANTTGTLNTAIGRRALEANITGNANTAVGNTALRLNTAGSSNTAVGHGALSLNTGTGNTAIGEGAGDNLTTGNSNTIIGRIGGTAGLSGTIIIGAGITERMRIDSSGNMGVGTSSPNAAARLDVTSTTSGFLPPRMTTAERDAISSPPNGLMLYNTTTDKLQVRAAGSWVDLH
jgi:hypothetical protein